MKHVIALLAAVFTITGSAYAQETKTASATTPEIIVTGTRIPQPNLNSVSPINVVTDEQFKLTGTTNVVDLLNTLPLQFQNNVADFSAQQNPLTAAGGLSTADLRGLGPQRTLVLVNGRRLGAGDASTLNPNPAPDLNQIPASLVDRVEVVTGGASAVYGSDAVAGVVNFIMKKNFEGIQLDAQYGLDQHTNDSKTMANLLAAKGFAQPDSDVVDGRNMAFSLIMGTNMDGGRANVTGYFTYRQADAVYQNTRDFSACKVTFGPACTGTSNSNYWKVQNAFTGQGNPQAGKVFSVLDDTFIPRVSTNVTNPPYLFNSNPYQILSAPDVRYTGGLFAHDQLSEKLDAYFEFQFMNDRATSAIAPSGAFRGDNSQTPTGGYLVNCDNPLLSAQQFGQMGCSALPVGASVDFELGRRNIEGGGRSSYYEHNNYRAVFGAKGDVGAGFSYDAYVQYYYTSLFQSNDGYVSKAGLSKSLQVRMYNGVPTCISAIPVADGGSGTDANCKPYNIFRNGGLQSSALNGVTPEALAYLNTFGTNFGTNELRTIHADFTNDLGRFGLKSPFAQTGVGINFGIEHRAEHIKFNPDQGSLSNDLGGGSGAGTIVDNGIHVTEEFIELQAPIADSKFLAEELTFLAGYRYSDYSQSGGVSTYKVGLTWKPINDVRFRTIWNRAVRAPNIIELYNPLAVTQTSQLSADPCSGPDPFNTPGPGEGPTLAECQRTGVTPAQYGTISDCPANQCAILIGGNVALKPETADTFSVGVTLTPSFLDNFTASIDYFNISVADEITAVSADVTFNTCLNTGDPLVCGNVVRNPTNGILYGNTLANGGFINGQSLNIAKATTTGVDLTLAYRFDIGKAGSLSADLLGTWLDTATTRPLPALPSYDCAGLFGASCQTVNPTWAHTLRLNWRTPWNVTASLAWRYINEVKLEGNSTQPIIGGQDPEDYFGKMSAVNYFDLSGIWEAGHGITMRAGVRNLTDKDPPLMAAEISGVGTPNTYPTYDLLGRVFFIGATAKF